MEPPAAFDASGFRNEVVKVYQSLTPLTGEDIRHSVVRGQYMASEAVRDIERKSKCNFVSDGNLFGYAVGVEQLAVGRRTFLYPQGKQMPTKVSEIVIHFKRHLIPCSVAKEVLVRYPIVW